MFVSSHCTREHSEDCCIIQWYIRIYGILVNLCIEPYVIRKHNYHRFVQCYRKAPPYVRVHQHVKTCQIWVFLSASFGLLLLLPADGIVRVTDVCMANVRQQHITDFDIGSVVGCAGQNGCRGTTMQCILGYSWFQLYKCNRCLLTVNSSLSRTSIFFHALHTFHTRNQIAVSECCASTVLSCDVAFGYRTYLYE